MNSGLMEREEMEKLGMVEEVNHFNFGQDVMEKWGRWKEIPFSEDYGV